jgi:anhydro-N-acetylmuramic acid kinase
MYQQQFRVLGLMSGTSLDGLDIACVDFFKKDATWHYEIIEATTISYEAFWIESLSSAHRLPPHQLQTLSANYGNWLGEQVNQFIAQRKLTNIDFIGSHGHTVHHKPKQKVTVQIGNGPEIHQLTKLPVVCDFRLQDVLLGGQGAPLVPVGDELLFSEFGACINLGGFANISFNHHGERVAFDICPVNIVLNELSKRLNKPYDENGEMAKSGDIIPSLLEKLNRLPYYLVAPPKSLGREWTDEVVLPLLSEEYQTTDLLRTFVEHTAIQIAKVGEHLRQNDSILFTGGGVFNAFLMNRIADLLDSDTKVVIPSAQVINYKEAMLFAFLAVLRWTNQPNCLCSVTGAVANHSSGRIYNRGFELK